MKLKMMIFHEKCHVPELIQDQSGNIQRVPGHQRNTPYQWKRHHFGKFENRKIYPVTHLWCQQNWSKLSKIVCWRTSVITFEVARRSGFFQPGLRVILFSGRGHLAGYRKVFFLYGGGWFSGPFSGSTHSFGAPLGYFVEEYNTKVHA